jgi:hypothetical protein
MREDFVTRLELQLTKAERGEERGGRLRRAWRPPPALGFGVAAAVLAALVLGTIALTRGGDRERVVGHRPAVVARIPLAQDPAAPCTVECGDVAPFQAPASGFGSVWIGDTQQGGVIRVDAASRRVLARIPVGKLPSGIVATGDAVWVLVHPSDASSSVARIDPASNRVTDRVPVPHLRVIGAAPAKLIGDDRALWMLGQEEGVRIDPRRRAVADRVTWNFADGAFPRAFGLAGDDLWARAEDGQLRRFDAHTGARKGQVASPPGIANLAVIPDAGVVLGYDAGSVTRIDASTGRAVWTTRLDNVPSGAQGSGRKAGTIVISGGDAWVLVENGQRVSERLAAVDLGTGRPLTATALKDYEADWLTPVGGELWYLGPEGDAVVVRP